MYNRGRRKRLDEALSIGHGPEPTVENSQYAPVLPVPNQAAQPLLQRQNRQWHLVIVERFSAPGANRVDAQLLSVWAVVPGERLDELAALDTVLFVELSRPGSGGHDFSMAVMGVDYIHPGGPGTRFSAAPITLGILDTGFMVGSAAPTTHQDLNKFGCGRNFTSDAAGVCCLVEARVREKLRDGEMRTPFLKHGDRVCIGMRDDAGHSLFGDIDQRVRIPGTRPMPCAASPAAREAATA